MNLVKKLLLLFFLFPIIVFSQSKTVTGSVVDDQGMPLPGVSIQVKNSSSLGAVTNFDGEFSIFLPSDQDNVLVFSYVGFYSQEVDVSLVDNVNISMETDTTELEEVVVVGYGTVLKKDLTGSVASVKVDETSARQANTVDNLLQGRVAGVQVTGNLANPNAGVSVKIRGNNSLRGNNDPLYVIDGIIVSSASEDATVALDGNSLQVNQNGLNGINPRDIESIEVLKDASATAIYGSRGANGVIIITTKKGSSGEAEIKTYSTTTAATVSKRMNMLDGVGYALYRNELNNSNQQLYHIDEGQVYSMSGDGTIAENPMQIRNWHDEIYRQGISQNTGMTISGGDDKGNYYVSADYLDHEGTVLGSSYRKGDVRINLNRDLTENLRIEARVNAFKAKGDFAQDGDRAAGSRSFTRTVNAFRPLSAALPEDDLNDSEDAYISNPLKWIYDYDDISNETRYFGNFKLTYKLPVRGLKYSVRIGGNNRTKERRRWSGPSTWTGSFTNGQLNISEVNASSYQINNLISYFRGNSRHRVNAVLGVTYDVRKSVNDFYSVEDFSTYQFTYTNPFYGQLVALPLRTLESKTQLLSYLGRVNYTLMNKYVFTVSFRADGSSKFSDDNRYSYFPSGAFAWRAHQEDFISNLNLFEELKIRLGWGRIGNQAIRAYQTFANYGPELVAVPGDGVAIGFVPLNIANENLKWETTEQINFGADFVLDFLPISGSIDVYNKKTKDLLQLPPLPPSTGFENLNGAAFYTNRGTLENKGLEIAAVYQIADTDDFNFSIGGNISFNKSKIGDLGIPLSEIYMSNGVIENRSFYLGTPVSTGTYFKYPSNIFIEGEEPGLFYGYATDGIYQSTDEITVENVQAGDIRIIDQNGDGVINASDRTIIGNPNPDFVYGLNLNLNYKNWSLTALVNGVEGNDIANGMQLDLGVAEGTFSNVLSDAYYNAWRPDAESNLYPRVGYTGNNNALAMNDRIIEDGSYFRLKNITLGYDIPVKEAGMFSRCNIYLSGQNLITITDYSGYDPEITSFLWDATRIGVDFYQSPNVKAWTVGLNLEF